MAILGSHNAFAATFGILGNIISFMVYLSPIPTFHRIYKRKCTEGFKSLPYLVALFSSSLWLYYALLKIDDSMLLLTINSFGCVVELVYIVIYITYANRDTRNTTITLLAVMNIGSFAFLIILMHFVLHSSDRVKILGWICVSVSVGVFASPLSSLKQVYRTKSVQFMPIALSWCLTFNAMTWLAYGYCQNDLHVAIPNVVGIALGVVQILVYFFYKNSKEQSGALEGMINVVVVSPLGTAEVFPIAEDDDKKLVIDDLLNQQLQENTNNQQKEKTSVEANDCRVSV